VTDIWEWVWGLEEELQAAGQHRTAELINKILDDRPEQVEAVLPEALAAARGLKNPWLEVYFRHWALHSRIVQDGEGAGSLHEAAALLEFAHRDDALNCPQSVCVTQDLVCCYANVDGLGWAEERMALSKETLDRIEPSRICYDCISREYADALMDQGRYAEARTYLEEQEQLLREAGNDPGESYKTMIARTFLHTGDPGRALAMLDAEEESTHQWTAHQQQILRAQCLAELGRAEEAYEALPAFGDVAGGHYLRWVAAAEAIVLRAPERNTWQLGRQFATAAADLDRKGAHRNCITVALQHARLALARGTVWSARLTLEAARRQLPLLRIDGGAAEAIATLDRQIETESGRKAELPVPAAELLAHLKTIEQRNPEQDVELLSAACVERPDDTELVVITSEAMEACGAPTKAKDLLWDFLRRLPDSEAVALRLLDLSLRASDAQIEVERLAGFLDASQPLVARWCRARFAHQAGRWREVGELVDRMIELWPEMPLTGARQLAAHAAMADSNFERAVALRSALVERSEEPGGHDWDLMTAASALGDWATVRRSAARLGMTLTSDEGPIRESWGWVRLSFEEEGRKRLYFGERTGPVTAQVVQVGPPNEPQHVRDEVVFDAKPLEAAPQDEEERKQWIVPFSVVHVSKRGEYVSWFVDGAHPGDEHFKAFRDELEAKAWPLWVMNPEDYAVNDPEHEGETLRGIYFFLATPAATPPSQIDATLRELTAGWEHPWAWRQLAQAAGTDADHHQHITDRYGL